jgi:hypothetical protein
MLKEFLTTLGSPMTTPTTATNLSNAKTSALALFTIRSSELLDDR